MRIIKPAIVKKSYPVTDIKTIRKDMQVMTKMLNDGKADYKNNKSLFLRHKHVSYSPLKFFVLRKELSKFTNGCTVFINPHILEEAEERKEFYFISPVYPEKGKKKMKGPNEILIQYTKMNGITVKARIKGQLACIIKLATMFI